MKTNKKTKKIKRTVLISATSLVCASLIFGFASGAFSAPKNDLPDNHQILENIMFLDPDTEYISINNKAFRQYTRLFTNSNNECLIVLDDNLSNQQKERAHDYVSDLNLIFSHINPNYNFKILEDSSLLTNLNANVIFIHNYESDENYGKHTCVYMPTNLGFKTTFNHVYINGALDYSSKNSHGAQTLSHEFSHNLGLGDCYYDNPNYYSVMNNKEGLFKGYYSFNDLMLLGCLYSNFNTQQEANDYITFVCEYLEKDPEDYLIKERSDDFYKTVLPNFSNNILPPNLIPELNPQNQEK